jgi:phosphatidylglycerol lysyltransferase
VVAEAIVVTARRWRAWIAPLAGVAVFLVSLGVLHRELAHLHLRDIVADLRALPTSIVATAVALTVVSYLALTLYDVLSVWYVGARLPYRKTALASFLGYAFAQNVGFTLFSGAPLRFRMYTSWGLSAVEVTGLVAFNAVSFWVGLLGVGGTALVFAGGRSPAELHLPFASLRPLGVVMLVPVLAYLALCAVRRRQLEIGKWRLQPPSIRLAVGQLVVAFVDWSVAAAVLFVLLPLPSHGHFVSFLAVFMLAEAVGLISQVPGGLGVFETVVLLVLPDSVAQSAAFGSLIAYRAIYYLLPLVVAIVVLAAYEIGRLSGRPAQLVRAIGGSIQLVAPHLLALITVAGGVVLLLFGALPSAPDRLGWLGGLLPLGVMELSHFLASIVGVGLLLLGWAVLRRLEAAYFLACGALAVGAVLVLLRGLQLEAATALVALLLVLVPARSYFYRHTALLREPLAPSWIAAVIVLLLAVAWIGLFAYRHVEFSSELWWQFELDGDASRFLRSGVGVSLALAVLGAIRLFGPAAPRSREPDGEDLGRVRAIVAESPTATANLALLGDKRFLFGDGGDAFVMYGIQGRSWVAMGDPVGPEASHGDLIWSFHELCDRYGGWTVFYEVADDNLAVYLDLGLTVLKIGEEAVVDLSKFTLDGRSRSWLRRTLRRLERDGCGFGLIPRPEVPDALPELRAISDAWLQSKSTREKGFSLGFFDDAYLSQFNVAVVRCGGRTVAFANLWEGVAGGELSIDLMRHLPDAPEGVMDFLFVNLMRWGADQGFSAFGLGMAPLAGLRAGPLAPLWNRLAAVVYFHGEHFYNFQGLKHYKEKFGPVWRPRYVVCPGGTALPGVLADLASLISGGLLGAVRK